MPPGNAHRSFRPDPAAFSKRCCWPLRRQAGRVALFGSRARGDAHEDSDYDIAVFLTDLTGWWREARRLSAIETEILTETAAFIHSMPYPAGAYRRRTPLMREIRREGIDL